MTTLFDTSRYEHPKLGERHSYYDWEVDREGTDDTDYITPKKPEKPEKPKHWNYEFDENTWGMIYYLNTGGKGHPRSMIKCSGLESEPANERINLLRIAGIIEKNGHYWRLTVEGKNYVEKVQAWESQYGSDSDSVANTSDSVSDADPTIVSDSTGDKMGVFNTPDEARKVVSDTEKNIGGLREGDRVRLTQDYKNRSRGDVGVLKIDITHAWVIFPDSPYSVVFKLDKFNPLEVIEPVSDSVSDTPDESVSLTFPVDVSDRLKTGQRGRLIKSHGGHEAGATGEIEVSQAYVILHLDTVPDFISISRAVLNPLEFIESMPELSILPTSSVSLTQSEDVSDTSKTITPSDLKQLAANWSRGEIEEAIATLQSLIYVFPQPAPEEVSLTQSEDVSDATSGRNEAAQHATPSESAILKPVNTYSPGGREARYFRFTYRDSNRVKHRHIPGGNISTPIAISRAEAVEQRVKEGSPPGEILKLIASWSGSG